MIAATIAAPASIASPRCPTLAPASAWVWQTPASGTLRTNNNGTATARTAPNGAEFWVTHEAAAGTGDVTIRVSTTLNVRAGQTYRFQTSFGSNYGNLNQATSTRSTVRLDVGPTPTTLFRGSTRPSTGFTTIPNNPGYTHTSRGTAAPTYTAATTGTITVAYVFTMTATNANSPAGDDISITPPTIVCL
ncbi:MULTISPECIES: hypothetical protein [unclassified Pseudoclavibacter]|uniref:hypothetical protein n=1 Tax=unclassified Pseudoclavibacter TaxID=2615177 RepID=UPI0011B018D4|nr:MULTISPECIES: hypothetical protein [unclassified Pseudoclavibacter]